MTTVKLSSKGQLVLPRHIRDELRLSAGDRIEVLLEDGERIVLRRAPRRSIAELKGVLPRPATPVSLEEIETTLGEAGLER